MIGQLARKAVRSLFSHAGYELKKRTAGPQKPADQKLVPRHLCPNGHKLYDFRAEPEFSDLARMAARDGKTLLGPERLLVLWQAVRNVRHLGGSAAEVGTFRGGSAKFLAECFRRQGQERTLHVCDTFEGHPDVIRPNLDGPHVPGMFGDTSLAAVTEYLRPYSEITIHAGAFETVRDAFGNRTFALAHVDVDVFESTMHCLSFFWPRLVDRGVVVVDDYGFKTCQGLKLAVDSFVSETPGCHTWYMHTGQLVMRKFAAA